MSLKDYAHWNEDAEYMWYMEEGRFDSSEFEYDDDNYGAMDYNDDED